MFTLDNRLALCAEFVRENAYLVDVGTDHAYLPVRLALDGRIRSAIACDVRKGPLENAASNIERYGAGDVVSTLLSDGLDMVPPGERYDIVIAGMGGELIAKIIQRPQWLKNGDHRLILQPMTRGESLRLFLCENGFCIDEERACVSGRKCYSVIVCHYDGRIRSCSELFRYIGLLGEDSSEAARRYISVINNKLRKKLRSYSPDSREYEVMEELICKTEMLSSEGD